MSVSAIKRKVNVIKRNRSFKNKKSSFSDLRGEKIMEQLNDNRFEMVKIESGFFRNILIGIGERSKIFYNKYLRPTVNYDYLEVKRIREKNIENVLWDTIRNQ